MSGCARPLQDEEVLVVRGAEAMVETEGYGRGAKVRAGLGERGEWAWRERTMPFMDALELDLVERDEKGPGIPDLLPGNGEREVRKACTAFSSRAPENTCTAIYTGVWGCGTLAGTWASRH